jgi:hypothetical protein
MLLICAEHVRECAQNTRGRLASGSRKSTLLKLCVGRISHKIVFDMLRTQVIDGGYNQIKQ